MGKKFVIGIGGTGMRCLESFIHLCAVGMFPKDEIHVLALDTDAQNGNFNRVKQLIAHYNKLENKSDKTFFSAKIVFNSFGPKYDSATFNSIADYNAASGKTFGENVKYKDSDICDLFLTKDVREMNLAHGYRAQTQMGSMLMYHAIVEAAYNYDQKYNGDNYDNENSLCSFINAIADETDSKVFVFGSVFGGTGASSIPVIPRALNKAAQIITKDSSKNIVKSNSFGASLLTNYFSFEVPKKNDEMVVATSDKFALNSQAALYFYTQDKTIAETYNRMYLIGREGSMRNIAKADESDTGGAKQKNPVDYLELLCASAAYDFFNSENLGDRKSAKVPLYCRTIENNAKESLSPLCFFDDAKPAGIFEKNLGMLVAFDFLNYTDFIGQMQHERNHPFTISQPEKEALEHYFEYFYNIKNTHAEETGKGWLYQLYESAKDDNGLNFIFKEETFTTQSPTKFEYNKNIFDASYKPFSAGFLKSDPFNVVKEEFMKHVKGEDLKSLISCVYETFDELYKK